MNPGTLNLTAQNYWLNVANAVLPLAGTPPADVIGAMHLAMSAGGIPTVMGRHFSLHLNRLYMLVERPNADAQASLYARIENDARAAHIMASGMDHPVNSLFRVRRRHSRYRPRIREMTNLTPPPDSDRKKSAGGVVFDSRLAGRPRPVVPFRHISGIRFKYAMGSASYQFSEGRFQQRFIDALDGIYSGDMSRMAVDGGVNINELNGYLRGALPIKIEDVYALAEKFGLDGGKLARMWSRDAMDAIQYLHPIPNFHGPAVRRFIWLARLITLNLGGLGPTRRILIPLGFGAQSKYQRWNELFSGKFPDPSVVTYALKVYRGIIGTVRNEVLKHRALISLEDAVREEKARARGVVEIASGDAADVMEQAVASAYDVQLLWRMFAPYDTTEMAFLLGMNRVVGEALGMLDSRRRRVLKSIYWEDMSDEETGSELGVTRARIGQIEHKVLRTLSRFKFGRKLRSYHDAME